MNEVIDILFSIVNGPLTIFMIVLIAYWILTAIGLFDADSFDIDVDLDMDVDVDADLGTDVIVDDFSGARGEEVLKNKKRKLTPFEVFLVYFNFIEVPFMMAFTFFIFMWWFTTALITEAIGLHHSVFGYVVMAILFIPSLFLMKFFTFPLKKLMNKMSNKGVENLVIVGRIGQTVTKVEHNRLGQVELVLDESPIKVYAMALNKGQIIESNTEVLIIKKSADSKHYLIDLNQ